MERKIDRTLTEWKDSRNRLPLLLQGARQVGKTYSLLQFGKQHYAYTAYFNFESSRDLHAIFQRDLHPERIIRELSAYSSVPLDGNDVLIVFDEIQACEQALASLKYVAEEMPHLHIAAAGSLLGIAINRESHSFPVGKVRILTMFPMDFEEYMIAFDKKASIEIIREHVASNQSCNLHQSFLDQYMQFLSTGGMPQIVKEFLETSDYNMVMALQKNLLDAYIADMAKYATPQETVRIMAAYNSVPAQLAKENKKFQYRLIKRGSRSSFYSSSIDWLKASGLVYPCTRTSAGTTPLNAQADPDAFKLYLNDIGLLFSRYGYSPELVIKNPSAWQSVRGAVIENAIACTLVANGYQLYYWESRGKAEVDFIIQLPSGEAIPVEVKSSANVRSRSLQQFVLRYQPLWSCRISTKNFGFESGIRSIPLYAAFCI